VFPYIFSIFKVPTFDPHSRSFIFRLGLDHLIGTPTLKPYMHGYFMSLKLYDAARIIANPFAYTEHREKVVQQKLSKLADSRIRTPKNALPKVNRALAEKILRAEMREEKKRLRKTGAHAGDTAAPASDGGDGPVDKRVTGKEKEKNVLNDPRFTELFENPEFQVDETSREYALLNPAAVGPASVRRSTKY
jgi:ribosome biogenesis protein ENP2